MNPKLFKRKDNREQREKGGLYAWGHFFRSISSLLWVIVVIIVLVALGRMFLFKKSGILDWKKPVTQKVVREVDWQKVNRQVEEVLKLARNDLEKSVSLKLDRWIDANMKRVDDDFLDWYFGYWTQQQIGLKSLLYEVWHWVDGDSPTAAEKITQEVQQEFATRVLRPQIAQMEIERIIRGSMSNYAVQVRTRLEQIPTEYEIQPADWERYIGDISVMISYADAGRQTSLPLKALVGATAGGAVVMVRALGPMFGKIGARVSAKFAGKAASKMATKTGGKVAAKVGGKFVGSIIAIGIIIWDVWAHYETRKKAMPVLRKNIRDYFLEVKESILHDSVFGVMPIVYGMERQIVGQLPAEGF